MKRRFGSYFNRLKPRTQEISRERWNIPNLISKIIGKVCRAIGAVVLFSIVMGIVLGSFIGGKTIVNLPDDMILVLNITEAIGETEHSRSLSDPLASPGVTVQDLVATLDRAGKDKRVRGLLVSLDQAGMELSHIQELRAAVKRFRDTGKFAHIYTASFADLGSGIGAYYLASAFDQIWMQPIGFVSMTGLALEMPFAKDALDKVGVNAQFLHREEYKSAMESFTNSTMSAPNREMMTSILDNLSGQVFDDIAKDRKIDKRALQVQLDKGLITGPDALKAGLITHLDYADVLVDTVQGNNPSPFIKKGEKSADEKNDKRPQIVLLEDYAGATNDEKGAGRAANVALVQISGEIIPGGDPKPGFATGDYIAGAIDDAAEDDDIKVIVLRINSPGGSPTASETIRRSVVKAKDAGKKILVSMGPLAASGGYWIAVDADRIFAMPSTLTGSIGVIMGKFELSGLWSKLGVNWDSITWGKNARMWSVNAPMSATEKESLNTAIDNTYDSFIERVANGRHIDKARVRTLAKGRAWTGLQASKNGLVDDIGGLDTTMDYAAKLVGVKDRSDLDIILVPKPLSPFQQIMNLMGQKVLFNGLSSESTLFKVVEPYVRRFETIEKSGPVQTYDPDLKIVN